MRLRAIEHVQLAMPSGEEAKARAFYEGVLGLTEKLKPPNLAARGGAWFERDDVRVHVGVDKDFRAATKAHVGFLVDELPALVARCREAGYRVVDDEPLEGFERAYVFDPFGNRLEFMEPKAVAR
jgi:catechol 2,3-dioxygenase-like lactoylglutathione lyase family enzyme